MNTTATETERGTTEYRAGDTERYTNIAPPGCTQPRPCCRICGIVPFNGKPVLMFAHDTCSQDCARTAAIVEAIDRCRRAVFLTAAERGTVVLDTRDPTEDFAGLPYDKQPR